MSYLWLLSLFCCLNEVEMRFCSKSPSCAEHWQDVQESFSNFSETIFPKFQDAYPEVSGCASRSFGMRIPKFRDTHPEVSEMVSPKFRDTHPEVSEMISPKFRDTYPEVSEMVPPKFRDTYPEVSEIAWKSFRARCRRARKTQNSSAKNAAGTLKRYENI